MHVFLNKPLSRPEACLHLPNPVNPAGVPRGGQRQGGRPTVGSNFLVRFVGAPPIGGLSEQSRNLQAGETLRVKIIPNWFDSAQLSCAVAPFVPAAAPSPPRGSRHQSSAGC